MGNLGEFKYKIGHSSIKTLLGRVGYGATLEGLVRVILLPFASA